MDTVKASRGERTSSIDNLQMEQEEKDPYSRW
jgi:twitching motility protein PilT